MAEGSMSVAVFAGLVSAVTVVAALSLLGAVGLVLSSARRKQVAAPVAVVIPEAGDRSTADEPFTPYPWETLNQRDRPRPSAVQRFAPPPLPPEDRPTTPIEDGAVPVRRHRSVSPPPDRRAAEPQRFFEEEEGEEYGLSTFDPLLRRGTPTPDWAEEEGSTEIFSAHNTTDGGFVFAEFEEVPTRVGSPTPGNRS